MSFFNILIEFIVADEVSVCKLKETIDSNLPDQSLD